LKKRGKGRLFSEIRDKTLPERMQMKEFGDIAAENLAPLIVRHGGEQVCDDAARIRPVARGMREVVAPHDPVDADLIAQAQPDGVVDKSPVTVLP